jgi:hypothetical protein
VDAYDLLLSRLKVMKKTPKAPEHQRTAIPQSRAGADHRGERREEEGMIGRVAEHSFCLPDARSVSQGRTHVPKTENLL